MRVLDGCPSDLEEDDEEAVVQSGVQFGALSLWQYGW